MSLFPSLETFRRPNLTLLGGLLAAGLLTAACSSPASPTPGAAGGAAPAAGASTSGGAGRGGTLRIAMTAGDIPLTDGQPDQGFEGFRFIGYQIYNGLTKWDYEQGDRPPVATPGLAESWEQDKTDPTKWTFKLRKGVKFHDGTDFNADVALWAIDRIKTKESPQYNASQNVLVSVRLSMLQTWKKIDDYTIEFTAPRNTLFVPDQLLYLMIPSKTAVEKWGKDDYPLHAAGTGPFKLDKVMPRQSAEFTPFEGYWGEKPKLDKLVMLPMPEAATRLAALRSGQADWIEVPPPDAIPGLKQDGYQVVTKIYPHVWPFQLNLYKPPFDNLKVRQAAMYAIDRDGMCKKLLNDTCIPATSMMPPGHPWYGNPVQYKYDPEKAKQLLKESGYTLPVKATLLTSPSGSGQMLPLPMSEFIQRNYKDVGIDLTIEVIEWNAMSTRTRDGFRGNSENTNMFNGSSATVDAFSAFTRFYHTKSAPPVSGNTTRYTNSEVDKLIEDAESSKTTAERDAKLAKVNEILSQDLPWLYIVHDLNPRVLSSKVKGFVQPQSWFLSLTSVWVEK